MTKWRVASYGAKITPIKIIITEFWGASRHFSILSLMVTRATFLTSRILINPVKASAQVQPVLEMMGNQEIAYYQLSAIFWDGRAPVLADF